MVQVAFFIGALAAITGAIGVIAFRTLFYSVLSLVVHLFSLAGLFLLLHAEFLAAAQIVVYAGAVMVLYVFVTVYVGSREEPAWEPIWGQRFFAPAVGLLLFLELAIAITGSSLNALGSRGAELPFGFGSPESIGSLLLGPFLFAFEGATLLLLVAVVGAIVLAFRRRDDDSGKQLQGGAAGSGIERQSQRVGSEA